jgi:hypothetical protein
MKPSLAELCVLALVSLLSLQPPIQGQSAVEAGRSGADTSHEVALTGTVSALLAKPNAGMLMGSHILLATLAGPVDVSLGRFGMRGKGALLVAAGQQIEVTGVMKTYTTNNNDKEVLLARTVKVGDEIYTVRNEHGFPISPQTRERVSGKNAGESL